MSTAALDLVIRLKDEASKGLENVHSGLLDIGKQALGFAAGGVLMSGLETLAGGLQETFAGAFEDARGTLGLMAQTEAVIASTGGAAGKSAQEIADYAASLSDAAGASLFGDDQIQQSQNLLLTFTNIKGTVLDAATAISVDMAQALGGAPKDSAIQLGKALNDPVAGVTALTRVGVTFTEEQKAQIEAMVAAGDTAGAQTLILSELNKEFGGSAKAAADATGGWSQFQGRLGEAAEGIAASLLPALNSITPILLEYVLPAVESIASGLATFATAVFSASDPIDALIGQLDTLLPGFRTVAEFVTANITPILSGLGAMLVAVVVPAFVAWATAAGAAAIATITALAPVLIPLAAIGAAVGLLVAAWENDWGGIRTTITDWWEGTGRPIFDQVREWLAVHLTAALAVLADFWTTTLWPAIQVVADWVMTTLVPLLSSLVNVYFAAVGVAIKVLAALWTNVLQPSFEDLWTLIKTYVLPVIQALIDAMSGPAKNAFDGVTAALGYINKAIQDTIGFFSNLADTISAVQIPDWLQGHSPPPMADWFGYVSDAAKAATDAVGKYGGELGGIGAPNLAVNTLAAAPMSGGAALQAAAPGVNVYVTLDGREIAASTRTELVRNLQRNDRDPLS